MLCRVKGYASYKIASRPITHETHECRGCKLPIEIGVSTLSQLCGMQFVCRTQSRSHESERRSPSIDDRCCRIKAMDELSKEEAGGSLTRLGPIRQASPDPALSGPAASRACSFHLPLIKSISRSLSAHLKLELVASVRLNRRLDIGTAQLCVRVRHGGQGSLWRSVRPRS